MRVLLVEDDQLITNVVANGLAQQNYAVDIATDGQLGWHFVETVNYDLILLDVMLPKLDGISFCQQLRRERYQMPVLLMTACSASTDKVIGLDAGADDYVVKPFELQELMARIRALLRRGSSSLAPVIQWGSLQLDPSTCEVTYDGKPLALTPKEYSLLKLFLYNCDRILSRGIILDHLWTFEDPPEEDTIKSHIKGLRRKFKAIGATTELVETVYGLGYRLKPLPQKPTQAPLSDEPQQQVHQQVTSAVTQIWQQHQMEISDRILVLEQAIAALSKGVLDDELRLKAEQAAHMLAGSLGIFGMTRGSQLSWEIESLLQAKWPLDLTQAQCLSELVMALGCELGKASTGQNRKLVAENLSTLNQLMNLAEPARLLEQFLHLAKHYSQPLYLVLLELSNFKQIQHDYGDLAGDTAMQQLEQYLRQTFRSSDIVARWGDRACVIGMYGATKDDGVKRLAEVLKLLHQKDFTSPNGTRFRVTLSSGAAEYPEDGADWQMLYQAARAALCQV